MLSYKTFERVRSVAVHTVAIMSVDVAPGDRSAATLAARQLYIVVLEGHGHATMCNRRFLCTGGSDASVAIVEIEELIAARYMQCDGDVQEVSISPDALWIAFSEWGSSVICIASAQTGANAQHSLARTFCTCL